MMIEMGDPIAAVVRSVPSNDDELCCGVHGCRAAVGYIGMMETSADGDASLILTFKTGFHRNRDEVYDLRPEVKNEWRVAQSSGVRWERFRTSFGGPRRPAKYGGMKFPEGLGRGPVGRSMGRRFIGLPEAGTLTLKFRCPVCRRTSTATLQGTSLKLVSD